MIKDIIHNNEGMTPVDHEFDILRTTFPACFHTDGSFDFTRFKEYLNDKVNVVNEGYGLHFLGKNYARLLASLETTTVVVPDEEHNALPENRDSRNIYISGDNLDALKHLLHSYERSIKCIYIDPPYNTGTDGFVYNDNFKFTPENLSERLSIGEDEAARILDMTRRGAASHSAWLTFMLPRLELARDLLSDDGVIFISIDDNEQANLKLLCDEVFGEENMICSFIWKKRQMVDSRTKNGASKDHDYLLCYGKKEYARICGKKSDTNKYSNPDNDPRGDWMSADMTGLATESQRPNLHYDLVDPSTGIVYKCPPTGWRYEQKRMSELIANDEVIFPKDKTGRPRRKKFVKDLESEFTGLSSILETVYSTQGTRELRELFDGDEYFDFPKPVDYIKQVVLQGINPRNDEKVYVLDFFGGSGTTAHAVLDLISCGEKINFIIVQIQELFKENSDAYKKANFKSIDELSIERIKRAAKKIKKENPLFHGDLGFKHYTLKEPESKLIDQIEDFDTTTNDTFLMDTLLNEFGVPTVLSTWLVRDGYGLTDNAKELDLAGYKAYYKDRHLYLLHSGLSDAAVDALVTKYESDKDFNPLNVVIFGYSFNWTEMETLKVNLRRLQATEKNLRLNFDVRY